MPRQVAVHDCAWKLFRELERENAPLPAYLLGAHKLPAEAQLELLAALQAHIDQSSSKTFNLATTAQVGNCEAIFKRAYALGLKGCTLFRLPQGWEWIFPRPPALWQMPVLETALAKAADNGV